MRSRLPSGRRSRPAVVEGRVRGRQIARRGRGRPAVASAALPWSPAEPARGRRPGLRPSGRPARSRRSSGRQHSSHVVEAEVRSRQVARRGRGGPAVASAARTRSRPRSAAIGSPDEVEAAQRAPARPARGRGRGPQPSHVSGHQCITSIAPVNFQCKAPVNSIAASEFPVHRTIAPVNFQCKAPVNTLLRQ
jgi:hypothetical protein